MGDETLDTDLIIAIESNQPRAVGAAIARGASANAEKGGYTVLMIAAMGGKAEIVSMLIRKGADVHRRNRWGATALIFAAEKGDKSIVRSLIRAGADVNAKEQDGGTALTAAARAGQVGIVRLLLKEGADITATEYGRKAWMLAAEEGHTDVVKILIDDAREINERTGPLGYTTLIEAALRGRVETIGYLIKRGADVNATSEFGETALMHAAAGGHIKVVNILLGEGASVNAAKSSGMTPLMYAARRGHTEVVKLLIKKGAEVNTRAEDGTTALILSADYPDILQILIEKGADITASGFGMGRTALMQAAGLGRVESVRLLLDAGADVNSRDDMGRTALMFPGWWHENQYGSEDDDFYLNIVGAAPEIAKILIAKGADVNIKMEGGWTALMIACQQDLDDVVRALVDAGADVRITGDDGSTTLTLAEGKCSEETLELLRSRWRSS